MSFIIGLLGFIIAFGLAVLVHELGHFLAAKAFKVPVERFVIGFDKEALPFMPRCIWERKIGPTVYGLSIVPLGGYVKMTGVVHPEIEKYLEESDKKDEKSGEPTGEEGESAAAKARPDSLTGQAIMDQAALYKKPFWQKTIIYSAGVIMNLVLAMAVLTFAAVKGQSLDAPLPAEVSWQAGQSWIAHSGIQPGDRVVSLNGESIKNDEDYAIQLDKLYREAQREDGPFLVEMNLVLERDGEVFEKFLAVAWGGSPEDTYDRLPASDIAMLISRPAYIEYVIPNRPADKAGLERGDTVLSIDGEPIDDWYELVRIVRTSLGRELSMTVESKGRSRTLTLKPVESTEEEGIGQIGIIPGNPRKIVERKDFVTAASESPGIVVNSTIRYVNNLKMLGQRLVQGDIEKVRRDLGGPVAIAQLAGRHANLGLDDYLRFLVMLNIALAVMNILPLPVLDGGHIVLAAYEAVFRRPVPPRVLVPVLNWGVMALLAFVILVTFSDLLKWFGPG